MPYKPKAEVVLCPGGEISINYYRGFFEKETYCRLDPSREKATFISPATNISGIMRHKIGNILEKQELIEIL